MIGLHFAAHHPKSVGRRVVIDLNATYHGRAIGSCWHPAFAGVIIHHDGSPHRTDTGLTVGEERRGQDRLEQDRTGTDRTGQDRPGQARPGQARPGQARPGQDKTGENDPGPRYKSLGFTFMFLTNNVFNQ